MAFDNRFTPPAPTISFAIASAPSNGRCLALIDTGSSHTVIPMFMLDGIESDGWIVLHLAGGRRFLPGFLVHIVVFGVEVEAFVAGAQPQVLAEILPSPVTGCGILGRDVLNSTSFLVNGPAGVVAQA